MDTAFLSFQGTYHWTEFIELPKETNEATVFYLPHLPSHPSTGKNELPTATTLQRPTLRRVRVTFLPFRKIEVFEAISFICGLLEEVILDFFYIRSET